MDWHGHRGWHGMGSKCSEEEITIWVEGARVV